MLFRSLMEVKEMKSLKVNVLKTVNKLTKEMVQRRNEEWPPGCISILHQPKRPGVKDKQ